MKYIRALFLSTVAASSLLGASTAVGLTPPLDSPTKLIPSDPLMEEYFAMSVSMSSNTAIIGAQYDTQNDSRLGAAFIFERQPSGQWQQTDKIVATVPSSGSQFGHTVSLSGDTVVIGTKREHVAVFRRGSGPDWEFVKNLTPTLAPANQWFGTAVAVSGATTIVGAPNADMAYVFDQNKNGPDQWGQVATLYPSPGVFSSRFSHTLALSGSTAVVGAMYEQTHGPESGAVYVFERDSGGANHWGQMAKLAPSDLSEYDRFGQGIAIEGDTAVVGAWSDFGGGSAYVFNRNAGGPGNWGQVAKLTALDPTDDFGYAVDISGDWIVVGAPHDNQSGNKAGAAYFFQRNLGGQNQWGQYAKVRAFDGFSSEYGGSVAIAAGAAIIGVPFDGQFGRQSGAAYAFAIPEPGTALQAVSLLGLVASGVITRRRTNLPMSARR